MSSSKEKKIPRGRSSRSSDAGKQAKQVREISAPKPPRPTRSRLDVATSKATLGAYGHEKAYLSRLVKQIVAPESVNEFSVSPNTPPVGMAVRHFHRIVEFNQAQHPNLRVFMNPNLFAPSYVSSTEDRNVPAAGLGFVVVKGKWTWSNGMITDGASELNGDGVFHTKTVPITDSAGLVYQGFNLTPFAAAQLVTLQIADKTPKAGQTHAFQTKYKLAGGAWTAIGGYSSSEGTQTNATFNLPANAVAFALITSGGDVGQVAQVQLGFSSTQILGTVDNLLLPAFEQQVIDNQIVKGRLIGMSMLITNTSSAFSNGGSISVGRVSHTFNPFVVEPHAAVSVLDNTRRYSGPLSTGAYAFWSPRETEELQVNDLDKMQQILNDSDRLFAYLSGWPAGASVRITFRWTVEFHSPKQLFEKIYTPPVTPEYSKMLYVIGTMPCCMCNPTHLENIKQWIKDAAAYAQAGLQFYDNHKWIIDAGVLALASM